MRTQWKRPVVVLAVLAITGCGLVANFGDKPQLGDINGADGGRSNTLDATTPDGSPVNGDDTGVQGDAPVVEAEDAGCPATQTACPVGCVATQTDPANCGACGKTCGTGFSCSGGACGDAVVLMSAGGHHVCAALSRGDVYCWGNDDLGEVGSGDAGGIVTSPTLIPRDDMQATVASPTQMSLGDEHTCMLFAGGQMKCWGNDYFGQLCDAQFSGVENDGGAVFRTLPHDALQQSGIQKAHVYTYTSLGTGSSAEHGCATTTDNVVVCWGDDNEAELAIDGGSAQQGCDSNGDTPCYPFPGATVGVPANTTQLAVGGVHTCGVDSAGGVTCWGANGSGELGIGNAGFGAPYPPGPVVLDAGVARQVAAGLDSTCAVLKDGTVACWGLNTSGELGHDGGADAGDDNCCVDIGFCSFKACSGTPSTVKGLTGATSVAVGCSHACALKSDGTVWCWGANDKGQLGTGDNLGSGTARQVTGLTGAKGISLGCDTSCAWTSDGTGYCWGLNVEGELATGSTVSNASSPSKIPLP